MSTDLIRTPPGAAASALTTARLVIIRGIMPRCGTNYIADLLRLHPRCVINPRDLWEFAPFRYLPLLQAYLGAIQSSAHAPKFRPEEFEPHLGRAWFEYLAESVGDDKRLVIKEPTAEHLDTQFRMFPASPTIMVLRDGRDIVASALESGFVLPPLQLANPRHWRRLLPLGDFRIVCRRYAESGARLLEFLQRRGDLLERRQLTIVRYEDVFQHQQEQTKQLLALLDLRADEYDWDALAKLKVRGSSFLFDARGRIDFANGQPAPADFKPVGRWRHWTPAQRHVFEKEAGTVARQLGYEVHWE